MEGKKKLDLVELKIDLEDKETGVSFISFVNEPANEMDFMCFSKQTSDYIFKEEADNQFITGVVMQPDKKIYRRTGDYEYNVFFSKETVKDMMVKYHMSNPNDLVNLEHNRDHMLTGVYMVESYLTNDNNKSPFDVPEGTWVATYYVADKEVYNAIKTSKQFNGFSLESKFIEHNVEVMKGIYNSDLTDEQKIFSFKSMDAFKKIYKG